MGRDFTKDRVPAPPRREAFALAKLSLPRLAQGVPRPRLFAAIDEARAGRVIWVAAPGGAGKTTLAASYLIERKLSYLWYQLDQDDADPGTFFYYLGLAARPFLADAQAHLPLLTPEYLPDLLGFARRYFRSLFARLPAGLVLVLDNYQEVGERSILAEILRQGITEIPPGSFLLVLSRGEPPPPVAEAAEAEGLALLDWEALRLSYEETCAIAEQRHVLDEEVLRAVHQRAAGWTAAVALLLEQLEEGRMDHPPSDLGSLAMAFHFLAEEFFNHLPEDRKDFLLKTSLPAHVTPTFAMDLSGNPNAALILEELYRRQMFVNRHESLEVGYQYHAMFREFLNAKAKEILGLEEYLALSRATSRLLERHGREEEALNLHLQSQDWELAIPLLNRLAPQLLAQGRAQIVAGWLAQLPLEIVEANVWLMYWKGMSGQFFDPPSARSALEKAYRGFIGEHDLLGQMLSVSAIVDLIFLLRGDMQEALHWADLLKEQLASGPPIPTAAIEVRLLTSLISILTVARPQDAQLSSHAARCLSLLEEDVNVNQRAFSGAHLIYYHALIAGDLAECRRIMERLGALVDSHDVTPINQIFLRHMCLLPLIMGRELDAADDINRPILAMVMDHNLRFMECIARIFEIGIHLNNDNLSDAKAVLEKAGGLLNAAQPLDIVWYRFAELVYFLASRDYESAVRSGRASLEIQERLGLISVVMVTHCLMALCWCEMGEYVAMRNNLEAVRARQFGGSPFVQHQVLLVESYSALLSGETEECREGFRESIAVSGKRPFFGHMYWWLPKRMLARLSAEALRAEIEVDFVRCVIRDYDLTPENSVLEVWPWAIKVYSLGCFQVHKDGRPLQDLQVQQKPLALLQVVIALGGRHVKLDSIAEILWPESEGDAGLSAFTTAMARLRKLIGAEAIVVQGGRVSLDERHCWLDVWALEHWLERRCGYEGANTASGEGQESVLGLYRGPFIPFEEAAWATGRRQRLREKMAQWRDALAGKFRASGEVQAAMSLLEQLAGADIALAADERGDPAP